jgi:phytoene dehydrogenase-like protein
VQYTSTGPWSSARPPSSERPAGNDGGGAGQTTFSRGGPGALAEALASAVRTFRGDIRMGADVERVLVDGDRVRGVVVRGGEEIHAPIVASGADPKRTLLGLLDPVTLGPSLAWRARNYRTPGVTAKVNLVLSGLPSSGQGRRGPRAPVGRS